MSFPKDVLSKTEESRLTKLYEEVESTFKMGTLIRYLEILALTVLLVILLFGKETETTLTGGFAGCLGIILLLLLRMHRMEKQLELLVLCVTWGVERCPSAEIGRERLVKEK